MKEGIGSINGDAVEHLFDYMAMSMGMSVSIPTSHMEQYDRIVDTGSRLFRVQIKGCKGGGRGVKVTMKTTRRRKGYDENDFDILAVYVKSVDSWYFYIEKLRDFRINLRKATPNNWSVFLNNCDKQ